MVKDKKSGIKILACHSIEIFDKFIETFSSPTQAKIITISNNTSPTEADDNITSWASLINNLRQMVQASDRYRTVIIRDVECVKDQCEDWILKEANKGNDFSFVINKMVNHMIIHTYDFLCLLAKLVSDGVNIILSSYNYPLNNVDRKHNIDDDGYELDAATVFWAMLKEWADIILVDPQKPDYSPIISDFLDIELDSVLKNFYRYYHKELLTTQLKNDEIVDNSECNDNPFTLAEECDEYEIDAIHYSVPQSVPISKNTESNIDEVPAKKMSFEAEIPDYVPDELAVLLKENNLTVSNIESILAAQGYCPQGTSLTIFDEEFLRDVVIEGWNELFQYGVENNLINQM